MEQVFQLFGILIENFPGILRFQHFCSEFFEPISSFRVDSKISSNSEKFITKNLEKLKKSNLLSRKINCNNSFPLATYKSAPSFRNFEFA